VSICLCSNLYYLNKIVYPNQFCMKIKFAREAAF
jgi:hypothetical protein